MLRPRLGLLAILLCHCAANGGSSDPSFFFDGGASGRDAARADTTAARNDARADLPAVEGSTEDARPTPDGGTKDAPTPDDNGVGVGDGGTPSPMGCGPREVCNDGLDNDCNGMIDEGCVCLPGSTSRCYDGPPSRAGVGVCNFGMQRCEGSGEFGTWSRCEGSGQPQPVRCGERMDFRCNGMIDEGCGCPPGMTRGCYPGPMGTAGVGLCREGMQTCVATDGGAEWGPCTGAVTPSPDTCDGMDRDCDGDTGTGCSCVRGTNRTCYSGPMGTAGVGTCRAGRQTCVMTADGRSTMWGRCDGETVPAMNLCDGIDRACNGRPLEGCDCTVGMTRACYSGPAGTRRVGVCRDGTQACEARGGMSAWATGCAGEVLPGPMELCGNGLDDNCNGAVDEGCTAGLTCPGDRSVPAGTAISLTAMGAGLRGITWTIVSAPTGGASSAVWAPNPPTALTESFTPYIVGVYTLRVSGTDPSGRVVTCMFNVTALPHGLRVQLTWNGSGDVDLHLHNATTSAWFNSNDCYYANLRPAWGAVLDFDNVTRDGPENTRVDAPVVGSAYTIGVHNYSSARGRTATVQIFCGTTTGTTPTATFTSRAFTLSASGNCSNNDFWRVARVVFSSPTTCTVTPINTYTTGSAACTGF
ncbi:MAG: hypothetical protein HY909_21040 [Deltaproteobacteria bacterium]|nr:hypothetical protein [Deltaproteobacteria bacterium]